MLRYAILVGLVLTIAGCPNATWTQSWRAPSTKLATPAPVAGDGYRYIQIGMGRWKNAEGRTCYAPVYIRDTGVKGPVGARGPSGAKGYVEVTPTPPPANFDANGGRYDSTTKVPTWPGVPWKPPANPFAGSVPFQIPKVPTTPSYEGPAGKIGQSGRGSFTGGSFESIQDVGRSGPGMMVVFGIIALIGGALLAFWAKQFAGGVAVMACGAGLIAAGVLFEAYPWVLLLALGVALLVGAWYVYRLNVAKKQTIALKTVVAGVEDSKKQGVDPTDAIKEVAKKGKVETLVRSVIDKLK